jgi:hypothetical protein
MSMRFQAIIIALLFMTGALAFVAAIGVELWAARTGGDRKADARPGGAPPAAPGPILVAAYVRPPGIPVVRL